MKLINRFIYFFGGFSIGLVLLMFFLSGKNVKCSYSPNARVIKDINLKQKKYSPKIYIAVQKNQITSNEIDDIIKNGQVNFSLSNTKLDSCRIYNIEKKIKKTKYTLIVENCNKVLNINDFNIN